MQISKQELRKIVLAKRFLITPGERETATKEIIKSVMAWEPWIKAKFILVFAATPFEPEIDELLTQGLAMGKNLYLPFIKKIKIGRLTNLNKLQVFNDVYRQPVDALIKAKWPEFDLVIMPGLAFDNHGRRLGQGSGWYDRFFSEYSKIYPRSKTRLAGLCFAEQLIDRVIVDKHDIPCDYLITQSGITKASELK